MTKKLTLLFLICILSTLSINATVYSGSCGADVRYSLDTSTGLLSITGTGAMTNYSSYSSAPWYSNRSYIKTVEISNGVTSIGWSAFAYCRGLTSVTIPNSVTSIGNSAFEACSGLTSVTIPNSVTSIGGSAFIGCSGLTSVTIPNSVTSIGSEAFYNCSKLTSVTIPNSVTSIGNYAFGGCYFEKNDFINNSSLDAEANSYWGATIVDSRNDGFVIKNGTLLKYTGNDASITIPNSVTSIESYAFRDCSGLTSVTIPNSVTSIGYGAFDGTAWYNNQPEGLVYAGLVAYKYKGNMPENTSITIKEGTLGIGSLAFYNCSGLTSIEIPNSVTSIGGSAFYNCSGLTSVTIGNSVTSIGGSAFSGCSKLTSVTIPNSVTSIGSGAFSRCSGLTSITIPNSVTSIEGGEFQGCSGLTSISVENGNKKYDSRNNCNAIIETASNTLIAGCKNTTIPNSVTSIGNYAFYNCSGLTSVTIPNSVTSIGEGAFRDCSGLTSVTIPNSVTSIGNYAFSYCPGLTSVTIPNSVTSIGNNAFYGADMPTVISLIENPFKIAGKTSGNGTFSQNTFLNATLYVPKGTIEKYKATDGWKDFLFIEEGEGPGGDTPEPQKCSTPTISYVDGKLTFDCETEGVEYVSSITPPSAFNSGSKTVSMPTTYKVTVYATKDGYENSDVATKDINVGGGTSGLRGDVNNDGTVNMPDAMFIVNKILNGKFPDE